MQRYEKARRWDRVVMSIRKLPHQAMNLCRSGPMRVPKPSGFTVGSADAAAKPQSKRSETMLEDIRVIIPCLDEETQLGRCIQSVKNASGASSPIEVVVADGGSIDDTIAVAKAFGAQVVSCTPGRGRQMNAGAQSARCSTLLFLHADCRLPQGWQAALAAACRPTEKQKSPRWGCFESIQLDEAGMREKILRRGVALRTHVRHLPYGDQALFVDREAFSDIGGFEEWRLLEDVDLATRLRRKYGRPAIVPLPVQVSARRWQRLGLLRTFAVNQCILTAWRCGVAPDTLAEWYYPSKRQSETDSKAQAGGTVTKR